MSEAEESASRPFPSAPGTIDHLESARFEGEVDLAAERPASTIHGLHGDRSTKWLVGGLVGGSLLLAAIISLVREGGDDDDGPARNPDVVMLAPRLQPSLAQAIIGLEAVRMDAISAHAIRAMGDAKPGHPRGAGDVARQAPPSTREVATHARTTAKPSGDRSSGSVRELPVPKVDPPQPPADPPAAAPRDDGATHPLPSVSDDDEPATNAPS
jgi:hypothetical protein